MKKIFTTLFLMVAFLGACGEKEVPAQVNEEPKEVISFFYSNTCPHCHEALAFVNANYPDLRMNMVNVATKQGQKKLMECARKFKLGNRVGTPLFCMGDNYIMGWREGYGARFDEYIKPFVNEKK